MIRASTKTKENIAKKLSWTRKRIIRIKAKIKTNSFRKNRCEAGFFVIINKNKVNFNKGVAMDFNKFSFNIDKNRVFKVLGIEAEAQNHFDYEKLYHEFLDTIFPEGDFKAICLNASTEFKDISIEAEYAVFALYTLGSKIDACINDKFSLGDYTDALILDAMANLCLFHMSDMINEKIHSDFKEKGLNLSEKYIPLENVDMKYQKLITEEIPLGVSASEFGMLTPLKSSSFVVFAGKDIKDGFNLAHDCSKCGFKTCIYRKEFTIKVNDGVNKKEILAEKGTLLLDTLIDNGYAIEYPCNKMGICGKCKVNANHKFVLSCKTFINEDMEVEMINKGYHISDKFDLKNQNINIEASGYGFIIDLGTTTVAMDLINLKTGKIIDKFSFLNPQSSYGQDIIMRIEMALKGSLGDMSNAIRDMLLKNMVSMALKKSVSDNAVNSIIISGNTVMSHILLNKNCEALAFYPFRVKENIDGKFSFNEVFHSEKFSAEVFVTPHISGFVGGDITSGLIYLNNYFENYILVDLGTNGEIVLKHKGVYYTTSTAAGPAFEGVNISCGIGSIEGAICAVKYNHGFTIDTINNKPAIGICGSGIIDITSELLMNHFMDSTGSLYEPYFENGVPIDKENKIKFTQQDIRQVQMSKSAVRSGIEILLKEAGIDYAQVENFIISGGLGNNLNMNNAAHMGLIPKELSEKAVTFGNTSLGGGFSMILNKDLIKSAGKIKESSKYINLSDYKGFNDLFIQYIGF